MATASFRASVSLDSTPATLSVNNQGYELHNLRKSLPISSNQTKKKREPRYANESASDPATPGQGQHQQNGNKMKKKTGFRDFLANLSSGTRERKPTLINGAPDRDDRTFH